MFAYATSLNHPIGTWNVSKVTNMDGMFLGVTLSTPIYDQLLIGWSLIPLYHKISFDGGNSKYSYKSSEARSYIINMFQWGIYDGGPAFEHGFISRWDTTITSTGSSTNNQIKLPLESTGTYKFLIDWGDGFINTISSYNLT